MPRLARFLSVVLIVGALFAAAVQAQGEDLTGGASSGENCAIASEESLAAGQEAAPDELYPYQEWLGEAAPQKGVEIVNAVLDSTFGDSDGGEAKRLQSGLVGLAADHHEQILVVVADPTIVDEARLQKQLDAALGAIPLDVRVRPSCNSAAELLAAGAVLETGSWYPLGANSDGPISYALDDLTSTWDVALSEADRELGAALEATLGDTVTVSYGELGRGSRLQDGEPHWGGAGIAHPKTTPQNFQCSSGFTAVLPNGNKGSVTAGHCFTGDLDQTIWSGDERYGIVGDRAGPYPQFDMRLIRPGQFESFARRIHTDPPAGDSRAVVAANNPDEEQFLCVSGANTRALCGIEIVDRDATFCDDPGDPNTCTPNLIRGRRGGDIVVREGDSGGPVYNRFSGDDAAIRGMIIAFRDSGAAGLFHKISTMKDQLGISGISQ